jgi:hypothetical protein
MSHWFVSSERLRGLRICHLQITEVGKSVVKFRTQRPSKSRSWWCEFQSKGPKIRSPDVQGRSRWMSQVKKRESKVSLPPPFCSIQAFPFGPFLWMGRGISCYKEVSLWYFHTCIWCTLIKFTPLLFLVTSYPLLNNFSVFRYSIFIHVYKVL